MDFLSCFYAVAWLVCCLWSSTLAFLPSTGAHARDTQSHADITKNAILATTAKLFNSIPLTQSTYTSLQQTAPLSVEKIFQAYYGKRMSTTDYTKAVNEIVKANVAIDSTSDTKFNPVWHFHDEQFEGANTGLKRLWVAIYMSIMKGDYSQARSLTGQYLHPLQDFYSHSNWVEMGNTVPNDALGREGASIGQVAAFNQSTCSNCTLDVNGEIRECRDNIIASVNQARLLTSGYLTVRTTGVVNVSVETGLKPPGKCSHGGQTDSSRLQSPLGGINKDSTDNTSSSHYYLHQQAQQLALEGTLRFFNRLRTAVRDIKFANFLNVQSATKSLTIVIDTTGSMGSYIEAVKQRCLEIVELSQNGTNTPKNYVLVPFNDPTVGPAVRTTDPEEFKRYLSNLEAGATGDGEDGPEMCFSGILLGAEQSEARSPIFVFTDAPARDAFLYQTVAATVTEKQQPVFFIGKLPGTLDPLYNSLAELSGGRVIVTSSNASAIFAATRLIVDQIKSDSTLLASLRNVQETNRTIDLSVDSFLDVFDVLVGHDRLAPTVKITGPMSNSTQDVSYTVVTDTLTTKVYRITKPEAGRWIVTIEALYKGWYAEIRGGSAFDVLCSLRNLNTNPDTYADNRDIFGNPLIGDLLLLTVQSTCENCVLETVSLLRADGTVSSTIKLQNTTDPNIYTSNITLPEHPFYLEIRGIDESTVAFQRLQPTQIIPAQVQVSLEAGDSTVEEMSLGTNKNFTLTFRNYGPAGWFEMSARDTLDFVSNYTKSRLFFLPANRSISARVDLSLPQDAVDALGQVSNVVFSVTTKGITQRSNANFFRKTILITSDQPDTSPPTCTILRSTFNTTCPQYEFDDTLDASYDCAAMTWEAELLFQEDGWGIDGIFVSSRGNGNVRWSLPTNVTVRGNANRTGVASAPCCIVEATFDIVDRAGLAGQCTLARWLRRPTTSAPIPPKKLTVLQITGIVIGSLLLVGALTLVVLLVKKCRRWVNQHKRKGTVVQGDLPIPMGDVRTAQTPTTNPPVGGVRVLPVSIGEVRAGQTPTVPRGPPMGGVGVRTGEIPAVTKHGQPASVSVGQTLSVPKDSPKQGVLPTQAPKAHKDPETLPHGGRSVQVATEQKKVVTHVQGIRPNRTSTSAVPKNSFVREESPTHSVRSGHLATGHNDGKAPAQNGRPDRTGPSERLADSGKGKPSAEHEDSPAGSARSSRVPPVEEKDQPTRPRTRPT